MADSDGGCMRSGPAEDAMEPIGKTSPRGRLEICLARFLQLSKFKSRAVRSPYGRMIEPIGEMPQGPVSRSTSLL
jgi:hypothetical protein